MRTGMDAEIVTRQILGVVKSHCTPNVVTDVMNDLRRSEALETGMTKGKANAHARGKRGLPLDERDKLDRLITLCQSHLPVDEVCRILLGIGDVFKAHGDTHRAEEMYTMALARGEQSGKKGYVAEAYMRRGEIYSRRALWKQSTSDLGCSRALFTELKRHEALGRVENILGTNNAEQGRIKKAAELFEHAFVLFERTHQTQMAGVALMNLGITCNIIGEYDSAVAHYKRAQSCFEEAGDLNHLAELHHNTGMTYLSKGVYKEAIRQFTMSHALSSSLHNISLMGLANLGKAHAYYYLHDLPVALKLVTQAMELFTRSSDQLSLADAYKVKGMIHRDMRSFGTSASYLHTSLRMNTELNNRLNMAESQFEIGVLETRRNNRGEALQAFQRARASFKKVGAQREVKRIKDQMNSLEGQKR